MPVDVAHTFEKGDEGVLNALFIDDALRRCLNGGVLDQEAESDVTIFRPGWIAIASGTERGPV